MSLFALGSLASAMLYPSPSRAVWPPSAELSAQDMARPENWPNDPGYRYEAPTGASDGRRGQWYLWSWVPGFNLTLPGFRADEASLGAGNHVDRAWGLSIGDPRVLIAVLDSGIEWENADLINKIALNTQELPMPEGASAYDANGDGVVNVADYTADRRITCRTGTMTARDPRRCYEHLRDPAVSGDHDSMPNDPNQNGVIDAGDLIRVFSDDTDADGNGYIDDIAGWDFFKDDNDPYDDTRFGHGTGEARDSSAETNNGVGDSGVCPRCMVVPTRVGDSFITDVNDFGQGVMYAVDRGASVVQEALGTIDNSSFGMRAIDYAYAHNVVVIASAADENSRHHNVPGTNNHTVYTHAIRYDSASLNGAHSFLSFNNCTNYGAQLVLSVGSLTCSSGATGLASGMAGLIYSEALGTNLRPGLSAEEVKQLMFETADDVNIPESRPGAIGYNDTIYPSLPGWDQRFGYGRTNARRMLDWVRDRKIPPEVDIVSPRWFTVMNPLRQDQHTLRIEGTIAARRAPRFDYTIEWAPGVEPAAGQWRTVRSERNVTAPVTDRLAEIDITHVLEREEADGTFTGEIENRYAITVRIRATARYDSPVGDVPGETRRVFYVHRDRTVLPGFPVDTVSSGESSAHLADLTGDRRREIVYATADGVIHAYGPTGRDIAGWPVHTRLMLGADPSRTPSYLRARGYQGGSDAVNPNELYEAVVATPAIYDLDSDGTPEVVIAGYHGTVYVFNHDGTPYGHGFPFGLPDVPSAMTSPLAHLDRGIFSSPVIYDLDNDQHPEIIFGAFDGNLYALDGMTGAIKPGFPVEIRYPSPRAERNRVVGSVGVGNLNGDSTPDLVVVSNARDPGDDNVGAIHVIHGDGNNHPGGAEHPNWPVAYTSFSFFPLVGEGIASSPAIADVDGDGLDELALAGTGNPTVTIALGVQAPHEAIAQPSALSHRAIIRSDGRGALSNYEATTVGFINAFSLGTFGDLTGDGKVEYTISGASLDLAINLAGGGTARPFSHLIGAWDARTGRVLPGFPRVIEDYTFFVNPAIADINGDGYAEVIVGTGGYYLRAFDACGREPDMAHGWPKFTGQWIIPSPTVGDVTGDGSMTVVTGTRGGYLWAWHTDGDAQFGSIQWSGFRHDNQNTGNYGTTLTEGVRRVAGLAPLGTCPGIPSVPEDSGLNPPRTVSTNGGCNCLVALSARGAPGGFLWAVGLLCWRRRRTLGTVHQLHREHRQSKLVKALT